MKKKTLIIFFLILLAIPSISSATFEREKTKTANDETFIFPDDALRSGPAIFALSMGKDRDNGEVQQKEVIGWQNYFDQNPTLLGSIPVYHFPVLSGIPFFIKGTIRNALYKFYADKADPSRVGVLFVSKTEKFAQEAGFPSDDQGTLVVVAPDGTIVGYVKGEVTLTKVEQLEEILALL